MGRRLTFLRSIGLLLASYKRLLAPLDPFAKVAVDMVLEEVGCRHHRPERVMDPIVEVRNHRRIGWIFQGYPLGWGQVK